MTGIRSKRRPRDWILDPEHTVRRPVGRQIVLPSNPIDTLVWKLSGEIRDILARQTVCIHKHCIRTIYQRHKMIAAEKHLPELLALFHRWMSNTKLPDRRPYILVRVPGLV